LSIASWRVLAVLSNNGGLRQTDLAEMTSIEVSTLSRLITRLVHDGLVRRTRSRTDSREVAVALTAKGRTLLRKLIPVAAGLQNAATRRLSKRDLATLKRGVAEDARQPDARRLKRPPQAPRPRRILPCKGEVDPRSGSGGGPASQQTPNLP